MMSFIVLSHDGEKKACFWIATHCHWLIPFPSCSRRILMRCSCCYAARRWNASAAAKQPSSSFVDRRHRAAMQSQESLSRGSLVLCSLRSASALLLCIVWLEGKIQLKKAKQVWFRNQRKSIAFLRSSRWKDDLASVVALHYSSIFIHLSFWASQGRKCNMVRAVNEVVFWTVDSKRTIFFFFMAAFSR